MFHLIISPDKHGQLLVLFINVFSYIFDLSDSLLLHFVSFRTTSRKHVYMSISSCCDQLINETLMLQLYNATWIQYGYLDISKMQFHNICNQFQ